MTLHIAGRPVGADHRPYLIAEMSGNHNGSLQRALAIIDAAAVAGADAVKLQTYTADTMTIEHDGPGFVVPGGLWAGRQLYELYEEAHTPWEWHEALFARGREWGITVFSTPFDHSAIELLESLGTPAYKIASLELGHIPLIRLVAATGKPLILSTGTASRSEITQAVDAARDAGCEQLLLLHCVSGYPTPPQEANLLTLPALSERYAVPVGLSDHTLGAHVAVAAAALGAVCVEKHVTLDRRDGGVDAAFSLEPAELASLRRGLDVAHAARGSVHEGCTPSEATARELRRSLYVVVDVPAGHLLTDRNVRAIRPGHGLPPALLPDVLGRPSTRLLRRGEPLDSSMFA